MVRTGNSKRKKNFEGKDGHLRIISPQRVSVGERDLGPDSERTAWSRGEWMGNDAKDLERRESRRPFGSRVRLDDDGKI